MINKYLPVLYFFMLFASCFNKSITNDDIDKFILKYRDEKFSDFMNVSISHRDSDFDDDIYMVAKQGGDVPPYVVHFNKRKKTVTSIDNKLLRQRNCEDYFRDNQIKNLLIKFIGFNIQHLSVDSNGNVFVTPFFGEGSPILLRLKTFTGDSIVKKGYNYELYKDNWYLKK